MEKEKKGNGPTSAGTGTSVVQAHRGADKKALPPRTIIITTHFRNNSHCNLEIYQRKILTDRDAS